MARYSRPKINRLISESDNAPNSDIKGDKLEELVKYLFEKIPGVDFYKKNVLDGVRAHELDVVFKNDIRNSDLHFLDFVIITECKNTAQPLGSAGVRWFIDKLRDRGKKSGILISLSGITGSADGKSNAHSEVLNALTRDNVSVILLDRAEITSLTTTDMLIDLILEKYLALTIERTRDYPIFSVNEHWGLNIRFKPLLKTNRKL